MWCHVSSEVCIELKELVTQAVISSSSAVRRDRRETRRPIDLSLIYPLHPAAGARNTRIQKDEDGGQEQEASEEGEATARERENARRWPAIDQTATGVFTCKVTVKDDVTT